MAPKKPAKLTPAELARKKMNAPFRVDLRSGVYDADTFVKSGKWVRVRSSNVFKIRFEKAALRLWVIFLSGVRYHYPSCSVELGKKFFRAASYGKGVWWLRRNGFVGVKG